MKFGDAVAMTGEKIHQRLALIPVVLLVLGTVIVYAQVGGHQFVSFDDHQYITENPRVTPGLTWSGIAWAFTSSYATNWHPLTWMSHMLDCQLFGTDPAGHHLTSVLFHLANSLLLFFLLRQMTGALWRSAVVAGLFAWHPLHVESVAWASERKDVLSGFFFMLTLMAYTRYAKQERPNGQTSGPLLAGRSAAFNIFDSSAAFLRLALLLFALGLMSKPMLVTLPFLMVLLDFWPLSRLPIRNSFLELRAPVLRLMLEKWPFFLLSLISCIITYIVQKGAQVPLEDLSVAERCANALFSYACYLEKTFCPIDLAAIYPYRRHLPALSLICAALLLLLITGWFWRRIRTNSYLIVGWLWFLGSLVPTIGLVQVGTQSMADRYTYLPSIGLFIALAWGLFDFLTSLRYKRQVLAILATVILTGCLIGAWNQTKYWKDSETLFRHAIQVTSNNYMAYDGLGTALDSRGQRSEALRWVSRAVELNPRYKEAQYDMGTILMEAGRFDEAIPYFRKALKINPTYAAARHNLANTLLTQGKLAEAVEEFRAAVNLDPKNAEANYNLATVLVAQSKLDEAVMYFKRALSLEPAYWQAELNLGIVFMRQGSASTGIPHLRQAVRLNPANADVHFNLGVAFLDVNNLAGAKAEFSEALRLDPEAPNYDYHLAIVLSREGRAAEAFAHASRAHELALRDGQQDLAAKAADLLNSTRPKTQN